MDLHHAAWMLKVAPWQPTGEALSHRRREAAALSRPQAEEEEPWLRREEPTVPSNRPGAAAVPS